MVIPFFFFFFFFSSFGGKFYIRFLGVKLKMLGGLDLIFSIMYLKKQTNPLSPSAGERRGHPSLVDKHKHNL